MKIAINGEILEVSGGGGLPEGTVAVKPVTKAEYDALTDEEKQADVVYAITDDNEAPSEDSSTNNNVYVEDEIVIGTFLGKPLYRRVFMGTFAVPSDGGSVALFDAINVKWVVDAYGMALLTDNGTKIPCLGGISNVNTRWSGWYISASTKQFFVVLPSAFNGASYEITVEYTKTTDTGGTT